MKQKGNFALPRAAYPQLERILATLYVCREDLTLKKLRDISRINESEFSGNFSAHKIEYNCHRGDIKNVALNYRVAVEELLYKSGIRK